MSLKKKETVYIYIARLIPVKMIASIILYLTTNFSKLITKP